MKPAKLFYSSIAAIVFSLGASVSQAAKEIPMPAPAPLSDAQALEWISTVNEAEIDAGLLATERGNALRVRNLADVIVEHHTIAEDQVEMIDERFADQRNDSEEAANLERNAEAMYADLLTKSDEEFDKAFVDGQVAMHRVALTKLDDVVIPSIVDPELHDFAKDFRKTVKKHFDRARSVQKALNKKD